MTTTTTTDKPKRATSARKPIPAADPPSSTSVVDALAAAPTTGAGAFADPKDLVIADNVRRTLKVDDAFRASIRLHGVLVPVHVFEHAGKLHVVDGQRRTTAAVLENMAAVPIHLVDGWDATDQARIVTQLVINDQRAELTAAEHVAAYHQLELAGLTVDEIAERTNTPKPRVEVALKIAGGAAAKIVDAVPVTLEQAATLATLQDYPEQIQEVIDTVTNRPEQIEHALARARRFVAVREALAIEVQRALDHGYVAVVVEDGVYFKRELQGSYAATKELAELNYLVDQAGEPVAFDEHGFPRPGEISDDAKAHITLYLRAEEEFDEDKGAYVPKIEGAWQLSGWPEFGYRLGNICYQNRLSGSSTSEAKAEKRELTDAEKEAKDVAAIKRRSVIANNKAWAAATDVRIAWIKEFLTGTDEPTAWADYVARCMAGYYFTFERAMAEKLLGHSPRYASGDGDLADDAKKKSRGPWILIALVLAWVEDSADFAKSGWRSQHAQMHLKQLAAWGYTLSEIEEQVIKGTAGGK